MNSNEIWNEGHWFRGSFDKKTNTTTMLGHSQEVEVVIPRTHDHYRLFYLPAVVLSSYVCVIKPL